MSKETLGDNLSFVKNIKAQSNLFVWANILNNVKLYVNFLYGEIEWRYSLLYG